MHTRATHSLTTLGLTALSLSALAPMGHAATVAVPSSPTSSTAFSFTTVPGAGNSLTFELTPETGTFVPVEVTASNFVYTGNWNIDTTSLLAAPSNYLVGHYGFTLAGTQLATVSLYNNGAPATTTVSYFFGIPIGASASSPTDGQLTQTPIDSSITLPFTSVGTGGSFGLAYFDAPTTTGFKVLQGTTPVVSGTFSPNGAFTSDLGSSGPTGSPAVPETSSLGLLAFGALPLLGLARRRSARK